MVKRKRRSISGILVLDKPVGVSSNNALQEVKRLFYADKAGHSGSLDPAASGVLPVFFGEATKLTKYLLEANKTYEATIKLGCSTLTGDAEGEVIDICDASEITVDLIEKALSRFRGNILQTPPMYSAIKHKGRRLYQLAREGKNVERKARRINMLVLQQRGFRPGRQAELDVFLICSKGTYVRSLAEDIGSVLEVGGHVTKLRRLAAGPFQLKNSFSLDLMRRLSSTGDEGQLDSVLQPMDTAVSEFPKLYISDSGGNYLHRGQPVLVPNSPCNGMVRLAYRNGEFFGIGEVLDDGRIAPRRMIGTESRLSANLRG